MVGNVQGSARVPDGYDVAIIGSGIAGSTLGMILARHSLRVIIFEGRSHPRFAIGESMILETSEMMRAIAAWFDVPEAAVFSSENFFERSGTSHGVKRHFGFVHHAAGQPINPHNVLQAVIPKEPHGHELHLYRQDVDYFLTTCAIHYGAEVHQDTQVKAVEIEKEGSVVTTTAGRECHSRYVVDAGGFRSQIADQFNLRHSNLRTHSRAIFTHMVDVLPLDDVTRVQRDAKLPYRMAEGTLHHVFSGGWLWVIPFNNHPRSTNPLVSAGLMLDPRVWPEQSTLSPEEEFFDVIARFPDIAVQFKLAKAVRAWTRTARIQYGSTRIVGDGWALLGHAAGFVDPLFSKGLYSAMMAVAVLADLLLDARETGDYSAAAFAPLELTTQNFLHTADRLVANSYASFSHPELWRVTSVVWLLGAYTELVKLNSIRAMAQTRREYFNEIHKLKLAGGGYGEFDEVIQRTYQLLEAADPQDTDSVATTVSGVGQVLRQLDWIPDPFVALLDGATTLPKKKLRLALFDSRKGFMRSGNYRRHFFGNHTMVELMRAFIREKVAYSPLMLRRKHRTWWSRP
jgi:tetracycline 7-halogenase / FADH2 O2-dependent halogenase